jgi:hypothetical protein
LTRSREKPKETPTVKEDDDDDDDEGSTRQNAGICWAEQKTSFDSPASKDSVCSVKHRRKKKGQLDPDYGGNVVLTFG